MFNLPFPLLLASTSPYRQAILAKLQVPFSTASPNIDESPLANESPQNLVMRLAEQKALVLSSAYPNHWIIGSDQVCFLAGEIVGKPHTAEAAFKQLKLASGKTVDFYTGICLHSNVELSETNIQDSAVGSAVKTLVDYEIFTVHFRTLTDDEIWRYIELDQPLDCAGSFKSEGLGITLFEKLSGRDPNTLIGLPLIRLGEMLREMCASHSNSPLHQNF